MLDSQWNQCGSETLLSFSLVPASSPFLPFDSNLVSLLFCYSSLQYSFLIPSTSTPINPFPYIFLLPSRFSSRNFFLTSPFLLSSFLSSSPHSAALFLFRTWEWDAETYEGFSRFRRAIYFFFFFFCGLDCVGHSFAYVAHFDFWEMSVYSNPESCRSNQPRFQLSHPWPMKISRKLRNIILDGLDASLGA